MFNDPWPHISNLFVIFNYHWFYDFVFRMVWMKWVWRYCWLWVGEVLVVVASGTMLVDLIINKMKNFLVFFLIYLFFNFFSCLVQLHLFNFHYHVFQLLIYTSFVYLRPIPIFLLTTTATHLPVTPLSTSTPIHQPELIFSFIFVIKQWNWLKDWTTLELCSVISFY